MLRKFLFILLVISILGCNEKKANSVLLDNNIEVKSIDNNRFLGNWVLNTYIGDKIFKDNFELKNTNNKLEGTLSVPKVFSSKLEKIIIREDVLSFEILVNEGAKPYRVKYQCQIHSSNLQIVGFATNEEDNSLIGGFVGIKAKEIK
ncbi:MAG: hypothetical protein AABZ74_02690 [Cyanobacteriota bacterium]|mgnify:CR=1 FL=1